MAARNNGEKTRKPVPPVEHQFKPGNPGRPKGSRNKLGEDFIAALQADFEEHGVAAIATVRSDKPEHYLKVIASILPKEVNLNVNDMDGLTDDQLLERIRALNAIIGPFLNAQGTALDGSRVETETKH